MQLRIKYLWSPDLNPTSEGQPKDTYDFDVLLQISVEEIGKEGYEVFDARVCSPSALSRTPSGKFVSALVLDHFDWTQIQKRLEKLLLHTSSCETWAAAIEKLAPYIQHADAE